MNTPSLVLVVWVFYHQVTNDADRGVIRARILSGLQTIFGIAPENVEVHFQSLELPEAGFRFHIEHSNLVSAELADSISQNLTRSGIRWCATQLDETTCFESSCTVGPITGIAPIGKTFSFPMTSGEAPLEAFSCI